MDSKKKPFSKMLQGGNPDTIEWTYFEKTHNDVFSNLDDIKEKHHPPAASCMPSDSLKMLLNLLGLTEFFPGKLSLQTTQIKINEHFYSKSESTEDVTWSILQKLIVSDCDFREKTLHNFLKKMTSDSRKNSFSSSCSDDPSLRRSSSQSSTSDNDIDENSDLKEHRFVSTQKQHGDKNSNNISVLSKPLCSRSLKAEERSHQFHRRIKSDSSRHMLPKPLSSSGPVLEERNLPEPHFVTKPTRGSAIEKLTMENKEDNMTDFSKSELIHKERKELQETLFETTTVPDSGIEKSTKEEEVIDMSDFSVSVSLSGQNAARFLSESHFATLSVSGSMKEKEDEVNKMSDFSGSMSLRSHETQCVPKSQSINIPSQDDLNGKQLKNERKSISDISESNQSDKGCEEIGQERSHVPFENDGLSSFHPMDLFMAIYQCCDPFLKRLIVHKFHSCQYAIPLVYNTLVKESVEISVWPLREIYLLHHFEPAIRMELPTISFLRFGDHIKSKSNILNSLLCQQGLMHRVFQDNENGEEQPRRVSSGMIELYWYTKKSRDDESLKKKSFTILNLRGDGLGKNCKKQLKFILTVSDAFVLFINENAKNKENLVSFQKGITEQDKECLIVTDVFVENKPFVFVGKEKIPRENSAKIEKNIHAKIFSLQKSLKENKCFEKAIFSYFQHTSSDIDIDENREDCREGKARAIEILKRCQLDSPNFSKDNLIPLQGKHFWCKWSQLDKNRQKKGKNCLDPEEHLQKCMKEIREQQVEKCNDSYDAIATFVKTIYELRNDHSTLLFFIFWVKQGLDETSKRTLPRLRKKLQRALEHRENPRDSQKVMKLKESIADASFGIEHIFREIGQVYEAFVSTKEGSLGQWTERIIEELPCIVARLSLLGQPLEIMDGDAANVPILWLKRVFTEINNYTGGELITSVSVIGVQSSGKSTLLNTMFGIQFPVSAGRCTRGIFAQFIPVSKNFNKFGFLMVIDTEGLRAPETTEEKIDFDNEIAALAVGLSDVSIINNPGETVGEMRDILQIVVHAFIRLKKSNPKMHYKQSGLFVHQNVSASDTQMKTLEGSHDFMDHLDKMAEIAAKEEQMPNISTFRAVIDLDLKNDRIYFPNFLENDTSTMPYVSQGYCKAVTVATKRIFEKLKQNVGHCNAKNIFWNLRNLWKGIQAETFIFSFRNCQEAIASKMLEKKFQTLTWDFEEKKHEWWNKNRPKLINAEMPNDLAYDLSKMFSEMISKESEIANRELTDFIDDHKYRKFMKHFEERRLYDLEYYIKNIQKMIDENINREKKQRIEFLRNYEEIVTKQFTIKREAEELARKVQNSEPDYGQVLEKFQSWWNKTLDEKCSPYDGIDVMRQKLTNEMEGFLLRVHGIRIKLFEDKVVTSTLPRLKNSMKAEDIPLEGICISESDDKSVNFPQLALNVLDLSFEKIDRYFEGLLQKDSRFDELHFNTILKFVVDDIEEHNKKHYMWFSINRSLVENVIQYVSKCTFPVFLHLNKEFEAKYGMRSELSKYRVKAFQIFNNTFRGFFKEMLEEQKMKNDICELKKAKEQITQDLRDMERARDVKTKQYKKEEEEYNERRNELLRLERETNIRLEKNLKNQQERKRYIEKVANEMHEEEKLLKKRKEKLKKELQQLSEEREKHVGLMEAEKRKYAENTKELEIEIAAKESYMEEMKKKSREEESIQMEEQSQREEIQRNDKTNIESSVDAIINELQVVLDEKFAEILRQKIKNLVVEKFDRQKQNLMRSVLIDLADRESLDNYKSYISSPETYVLKWLTEYSKKMFFGCAEGRQSEYQQHREEFVTPMISFLKGCATRVTHYLTEQNIRKWVYEYQNKLAEDDLVISSTLFDYAEYEIHDFDYFLIVLKEKLTDIKHEYNRKQPESIKWKEKTPYEEIMNFLWGCKENCPWCNEPCKSSISNHADSDDFHECLQHRPVGIHGVHILDTKELCVESCDFKVQTKHTLQCAKWCGCNTPECVSMHLYSNYKNIIPRWKIVPCADMSNSRYWEWVIGKFYKDFEEQFGKTFSKIPPSWMEISKKEAIESLEAYMIDDEIAEQLNECTHL